MPMKQSVLARLFQSFVAFTLFLWAGETFTQQDNSPRDLTVLYTNDEHGWMEGMRPDQGAANLYQLWQEREGYRKDGPFLVLSGGDNWTGPAISTWVEGQSMVEVMNAMDYDASAVGNHEFDFGLEALTRRTREAEFPYLSANTSWKASGLVPEDLGILPYTIVEVYGFRVGIIGLTTTSTPYVTNPANISDLAFTDYEAAVRKTFPALVGTDLQFIIAHVCMEELEPLVESLGDLGIDLAGGGHCNELVARTIGDTAVLGGGYHYTSYARAVFRVDNTNGKPVLTGYGTVRNGSDSRDKDIAGIITKWDAQSSRALDEVLGWSRNFVPEGKVLDQSIIESWLLAYPEADIAITNRGGIRAALPKGKITLGDIVGMLPFDNTIIDVQVSGARIRRSLDRGNRLVVAGLERKNDEWILSATGLPLADRQQYRLLTNSFLFSGGDFFSANNGASAGSVDTGINYRQPFVDWIKSRQSSAARPISLD
jgi:5'-nucleotidase/UDP-sugar diphosphatase